MEVNDHMFRSLRVLFAAALFAVPFVLTSAATAQTCAPLDVSCTADPAAQEGQDTAGGAGDAVGDAADDAANAANDAATTAQDTVSTVRDTVDDALHDGGIDPPIGGADGGGSGHGDGNGGGGGGTHDGGGGHGGGGGVATVGTSGSAGGNVRAAAGASAGATPGGSDMPSVPTTDPTRPDVASRPPTDLRQVAAAASVGIAVMALLLGAVGVFLTLQDRLDRRDPKLAPAAIDSDRVLFS